MSFQNIIDDLKSVLKLLPEFDDKNVSFNDYRILSQGKERAIVLTPGPFSQEPSTFDGDFTIQWEIKIELYIRYSNEPEVATRIAEYRDAIIEKVNQYPKLNGNNQVLIAYIRRGDEPLPVFNSSGEGPFFWLQVMICAVTEDVQFTSQE